jgi:hypothetical protein
MKKEADDGAARAILTDAEVRAQVRALVISGNVEWTDHAEMRMAKRGIDKGQAKQCLRSGYFVERPHFPARRGPLQYEFSMRANVDGRAIEVPASLIPDRQVVVITVKVPRR